jgi:hypothetical protein
LPQMDSDNNLNEELLSLQAKVQNLPSDQLDREFAELSVEISFLQDQIQADVGSYGTDDLAKAQEKINHYKRRSEIIKIELDRRTSEMSAS